MTDALLRDRPADGVVRLTLNRPDVLNAIDMALSDALFAALDDTDDARVIVIGGAGGSFSAGFDIAEMRDFDGARMREVFAVRDRLTLRIAEHRLPVIVAVDGVAYGAGALIAMAADLRVGGPTARFRVTAASYGCANATWSLPAIVGASRAKEILMTSRAVEAAEAKAIGLLDELADDAGAAAVALAARIAAMPPRGVQGVKRLVNQAAAGWQAEHDWMLASLEEGTAGDDVFAITSAGRKA